MPKVKFRVTLQKQDKKALNDERGKRIAPYRFKKGQSGNPGGAKKGVKRIGDLLNHYAVMDCPAADMREIRQRFPGTNRLTLQDAVMLKTYALALDGESWALEFLAERTEGKVPQGLQHLIQNPTIAITVSDTKAADAIKGLQGNVDNI